MSSFGSKADSVGLDFGNGNVKLVGQRGVNRTEKKELLIQCQVELEFSFKVAFKERGFERAQSSKAS